MNDFDAAIDYLEEYGWTKHHMFGSDRSACIMGAFEVVVLGNTKESVSIESGVNTVERNGYWNRIDIVTKIVREQFPGRDKGTGFTIANFNDHRDTTYDDVIMVLEKASIKWDETH